MAMLCLHVDARRAKVDHGDSIYRSVCECLLTSLQLRMAWPVWGLRMNIVTMEFARLICRTVCFVMPLFLVESTLV